MACVDEWYGGSDGQMKNCPNCSTERGYAETVRMAGMDDFLESIRPTQIARLDHAKLKIILP